MARDRARRRGTRGRGDRRGGPLLLDAAFLLFHLIFFPQGNFLFDPGTERLTQLFPDQLFSETSIALAAVGLIIALAVTLAARRRASGLGA